MSSFNINNVPNNIPGAIAWLIEGVKILFGRTASSGGGSGSLTVGNPVSGGGTNRVLYEDASQNLAASTNFTFNDSNLSLGAVAGTKGSVTLKGSTSGAVTLGVANAAGTYTVYMPNAQGSSGTSLVNDGSGNLSWGTPTYTGIDTQTGLSSVTTVTVSHGLGFTPSKVFVTEQPGSTLTGGLIRRVSAITATQFIVTYSASVSGDVSLGWQAFR